MSSPENLHPTEMISAYLDGAAGPEEQAQAEEHLRTCARCREMAEDFRALAATAAREEPPPVPPDLAARIRRQVERARSVSSLSRRPAWRKPLALAAAGLAVVTLVWVATRQQAPGPASVPLAGPVAQQPAPQGSAAQGPAAGLDAPAGDKTAREWVAPVGTGSKVGDLGSPGSVQPPSVSEKPADEARTLPEQGGEVLGAEEESGPIPEAMPSASPAEDTIQTAKGKDVSGAAFSAGGRSPEPRVASRTGGKGPPAPGAESESAAGSPRELAVSGAAAGPRSLLFETPDTSLYVSEDGLITLILRGYACSANVAPPAPADGEPSLLPELAFLFTRASSRETQASVARAAGSGGLSTVEAAARPKSITLRDSEGGTLYTVAYGDSPETAPPAAVLELEEEIRHTVWLRFRKTFEERCGPIPGVPEGSVP